MNLTRGRKETCKNNAGGIKELYLMTYVEYDVRSIIGYRDLFITSFPESQIYKYEGQQKSFTENYNEEGFYSQEINMKLIKQDLSSAQLLSILVKNKVRAVIVDWLGNIRLAGCVNGMDAELKSVSGGSKVDFSGYEIRLSGEEEFKAPFVSNLDGSGLTDKDVDLGCLLASSDRPASLSNKVSDCNAVL